MALTRSLARLEHPTLQHRSRHGTGSPACAFAAQAERARLAGLLHRRQPALSLRQSRLPRLDRQDTGRGDRPRGRSRSTDASSISSTAPTSTPRLPASASASSASSHRSSATRSGSASTIYPDRGPRGDVRGVLATYTDVDNIKRLELEAGEREHRLRIVTDSVGLPIFYFDRGTATALRQQALRRLHRRPGRRPPRPAAEELRRARRARGNAGLHRARLRRRHGELRAARAAGVGRAALGAHHAVPGSRARRQDRRRLRRHQRHRRRHPHPRGAEGAGSAAAAVRRQHSGADRLSRQAGCKYTLRQPGVRQLGVPAAGSDLRQDAVRGACRTTSTRSCGRSSSARRRARTSSTSASASAPTASGAGCTAASRPTSTATGKRARPVLHRIRHPRPQAHRAGARDARGAAAAVHRQHSGAGRLRRHRAAATPSSTMPSCAWSGIEREDSHRQVARRRCSAPRSSSSSSRTSTAPRSGESVTYERENDRRQRPHALAAQQHRPRPAISTATIKGYYIVGHDITDLQAGSGCAGRARVAAARDHGRRARAGGLHRSRRALPVRQSHVPPVFRPDARSRWRACACATWSATASTPARRRCSSRALQGESTAFDRLVPGAGGAKRWMTIRVVPDADAVGRGARRVRADERHPWPEAGAGSVARQRGRAAAHHGQRARRGSPTSTASTAFASSTGTTRNGCRRAART